jgi:Predicted membrane protein
MKGFLFRVVANMAGLWIAVQLVSGISVPSGSETWHAWAYLAAIAAILALVNSLIKPIVKVVAFPLYLLTFGLFALVTNWLMLWLTSSISVWFGTPLEFDSWQSMFFAAIIVAFVSSIVNAIIKPRSR